MGTTPNKNTRARVEWYTRSQIYTVTDTVSNKLVIQTSNYAVADYWRTRVNGCSHPFHYDILEHDHRVAEWESRVEQSTENSDKMV